jgi:hypothetical protein
MNYSYSYSYANTREKTGVTAPELKNTYASKPTFFNLKSRFSQEYTETKQFLSYFWKAMAIAFTVIALVNTVFSNVGQATLLTNTKPPKTAEVSKVAEPIPVKKVVTADDVKSLSDDELKKLIENL